MTRVSEVMTRGVRAMTPNESLAQAAQAMGELDVGVIPVFDGERIVGIVTDRDLVVRGVAQGRAPDSTPLRDVMSKDVCACYDDESVAEVLQRMAEAQIRRMPVVDRGEHLVGIVSLGDMSVRGDTAGAGDALEEISEPSQPKRGGQSQASGPAGGGSGDRPRRRRG